MSPKQLLLKHAKKRFETEHGKTHIESGYPEVIAWNEIIIFAPSKIEISAYIKTQRLNKVMLYGTSILVSLMIICIITYNNVIISLASDIIFIFLMTLFSLLLLYMTIMVKKLTSQKKKVYKNKVIVYNLHNKILS